LIRKKINKLNKEIKKQERSTIQKITGFQPVVSENSKVLILGTMPSEKSLIDTPAFTGGVLKTIQAALVLTLPFPASQHICELYFR